MISVIKRHRAFLLLLALFIVGSLLQQRQFPVFEGSDEVLHFNYTMQLYAENQLPDRALRNTNATQQASGQPPLSYWVGSLLLRALNQPIVDGDILLRYTGEVVRNRWYSPHEVWNRVDNRINFYHGLDESLFGMPQAVSASHVLRMLATAWGVLAVTGAYGAAQEVFHRKSWALTAAAIFAFIPTMLYLSSYITNDTAAAAFATLAIWQTLRLLRLGTSPSRLLLLSALISLAALSKVSALLIAPGIGLAILIAWRRQPASRFEIVRDAIIFAIPVAILFLPWVIYGMVSYGDPFGFNTHRHLTEGFYFEQPRSLAEILPLMPHLYLSYWGWSFYNLVHPLTFTIFGIILALSLSGYVLGKKVTRWTSLHQQQALVLSVMFIVVFLGMIRWMQQLSFTGGRLMYPSHIAVALALTAGLYLLAGRFRGLDFPLRAFSTTVLATAGLIFVPIATQDVYGLPPFLDRAQLPALSGGIVDFGGAIRLLGIHQPDPRITADRYPLIVCWEVLQETDRPAAYSIKLIHDGLIVADRTTIFGLGRYNSPLWEVGKIFCDNLSIPLDDPDLREEPPLESATIYDIVAVVLNAETLAVDWEAAAPGGVILESPIVGQAISPAGQMTTSVTLTPSTIAFPNFARLEGYHLEGALAAEETLTLTLAWEVTASTPDNWSQFIHLYNQDGFVGVLADSLPRSGAYPTWAWESGEHIVDRWSLTLPTDLPPGEYSLQTGFYRPDTGERMPVVMGGTSAANHSAELFRFNTGS
ncbi:MAG: glycosyltransferase family 39 protein [Anaerolineae bacterium]|nr:glycosyltransferase family 39 protein [Anaerolineae bacterium]